MADEETKPTRKAKDNPWYRLATLHGEPSKINDEIAQKNRATWNRWMASRVMASRVSDDLKAVLLKKERSVDEFTPFSEDELRSVEAQVGSPLGPDRIDFSNTVFEAPFFASGFIFPHAIFIGATFSFTANFGNATFDTADFATATFSGVADFRSATFSGGPETFASATFHGYADFRSATFSGDAYFADATFGATATFASATFSGDAYFTSATFSGHRADFASATFSGDAYFTSAPFRREASFTSATFSHADFASAIFSSVAHFASATFSSVADFVNSELKGVTVFTNVKFARPPRFYGAKLHEGTTWRDVCWPAPPKDREQAGEYVEAYERLKLEMDKLKKHGDELDFFARELVSRRVLLGFWKGLPIAVYGFLSSYGRSYVRPLLLLAATVLVGIPFFAAHLVDSWTPLLADLPNMRQAIGVSFANTFGVFGRPLMKPEVLLGLPDWLKALATIQTILGIVLLFLFGLGIRNRFRMK